jgi:hypothetical protein
VEKHPYLLARRVLETDRAAIGPYMPDPRALKVGDRVRFVSLPDEWRAPGFTVQRDDTQFMKTMIRRSWPSRVFRIDEYGTPWIAARIRRKGRVEYHMWGISEKTGWRLVCKRV